MKPITMLTAVTLACAGTLATAQTQPAAEPAPVQAVPMVPPPPPAPPVTWETPAPIHIETKVDMHTEPGPPVDMHAAREEAVNALAWAKAEGCRSDPAPRECIRRAQDEYNAAMARLRNR